MTNHDVEHAIKKRMSGDVRDAFVAIGECSLCRAPRRAGSPFSCHCQGSVAAIPAAFGLWRLPVRHGGTYRVPKEGLVRRRAHD